MNQRSTHAAAVSSTASGKRLRPQASPITTTMMPLTVISGVASTVRKRIRLPMPKTTSAIDGSTATICATTTPTIAMSSRMRRSRNRS